MNMTHAFPPVTKMRKCAFVAEDIGVQLSMLAIVLDAADDAARDSRPSELQADRIRALLTAAGHFVTAIQAKADTLVDRMLDASEK